MNRWTLRPDLGASKAVSLWSLEFSPGATFYIDNDDFFGNRKRNPDAERSMQSHLSETIKPGCRLAFDASYFEGDRTTVNAIPNSGRQEGFRIGVTFLLPVNHKQSV